MGYLATEIIVLLAGAAVIGLIIGWALFGLGKSRAAATTVAVRDEKTENELKSERESRKKAEVRILELEARETNFGERLQERDTKIAELMHQLDEQARFRVQSAAQFDERDQKIAALEKALAERPVEVAAPVATPAPEPVVPGIDPELLAEKDLEIARLTEEAQRLTEEVSALTTGLENVKASDVQHSARVAQLERENAELRATLITTADATPTTSEEKDQIIARLNEEVTGLRAAYEAAEQALEEQDAAIDKLTRDLLTAQKKLSAPPEPAKAGPTRGGAAAKGNAPVAQAASPAKAVTAPPLPGPLEAADSTVAISLDALVAQIDASPAPIPPPLPPPAPKAPVPAPVEASESTVAISLDALVAQIDSGPAKAPPPLPPPPPAPAPKAPAPVEASESTVAISLDALVAQIDSGPAKAAAPAPAAAPIKAAAPAAFDLSEATVALSLDALVAQIDSGPAKAAAPITPAPVAAPKAPPAPEPNESTVAISLDALVAQIEAGAPKSPPTGSAPRPAAPPAAVEANESTVAISLADLVAAVDNEPETIALELDAPPAPAGAFDDLQRIRGIGSNTAKRLNSAGIRTWSQMAALSEKDLNQVADLLKISLDKIKREQWVEQARALKGS